MEYDEIYIDEQGRVIVPWGESLMSMTNCKENELIIDATKAFDGIIGKPFYVESLLVPVSQTDSTIYHSSRGLLVRYCKVLPQTPLFKVCVNDLATVRLRYHNDLNLGQGLYSYDLNMTIEVLETIDKDVSVGTQCEFELRDFERLYRALNGESLDQEDDDYPLFKDDDDQRCPICWTLIEQTECPTCGMCYGN